MYAEAKVKKQEILVGEGFLPPNLPKN